MCIYCKEPSKKNHYACLEAYGLDYDPTSHADAIRFLRQRRRILGLSMKGVPQ